MKRKFVNFIAVVLLLAAFSSIITMQAYATYVPAGEKDSVEEDNVLHDYDSNILYLSSESKRHFNSNELIQVKYAANIDGIITDIEYDNQGFQNFNITISAEKEISISAKMSEQLSTAKAFIYANTDSGITLSSAIYAVFAPEGIFISSFSEESAFIECLGFMLNTGKISLDEYIEIRNKIFGVQMELCTDTNIYQVNDAPLNPSAVVGSGDTSVTLTTGWADDYNVAHSFRKLKVELYDEDNTGDELIASGYTDDNGSITFKFNNPGGIFGFENGGYDVFLKYYLSDNYVIMVDGSGVLYGGDNRVSIANNISTGSHMQFLLNFRLGVKQITEAIQVYQATLTAKDFAFQMLSGGTLPAVTVQYPATTQNGGCEYHFSAKKIKITRVEVGDSTPSSYGSWDVIMHEYGHHVSSCLNIANYVGGEHTHSQNAADAQRDVINGKRFAWGEAWASAFAFVSQHYYRNSYTQNIAYTNDARYTSYNGVDFSVENCTDRSWGDVCEGSIIAILWDLYDNTPNETNSDGLADTLNLGVSDWWASSTVSGNITFSHFIEELYDRHNTIEFRLAVGELLSYYNVASDFRTSDCYNGNNSGTTPYFRWNVGGGGRVGINPDGSGIPQDEVNINNNSFYIIFLDDNKDVIFYVQRTVNNYEVTNAQWTQIKQNCTNEYTVILASKLTGTYANAGYYFSEGLTYQIP